jgi:hypothetical protein
MDEYGLEAGPAKGGTVLCAAKVGDVESTSLAARGSI